MEKNNEQLRKEFESWWDGRGLPEGLKPAFFMVWQSAVAAALAAQAQQESQWISVEERLPEKFVDVVVYPRPTDYICEAAWLGDAWYWSDYELNFGVITNKCVVTHWLPIPPAPEGAAKCT